MKGCCFCWAGKTVVLVTWRGSPKRSHREFRVPVRRTPKTIAPHFEELRTRSKTSDVVQLSTSAALFAPKTSRFHRCFVPGRDHKKQVNIPTVCLLKRSILPWRRRPHRQSLAAESRGIQMTSGDGTAKGRAPAVSTTRDRRRQCDG